MTPNDVHYGFAEARYAERSLVLQKAYIEHPERFVKQVPVPPALPTATWINKPSNPAAELVSLTDANAR